MSSLYSLLLSCMPRGLKRVLKRAARACGYDPAKHRVLSPAVAARKRALESFGIDVVLDVGANVGQFARSLRDPMGFRGAIVSIEPLPDAFARLKTYSDEDPSWQALNVGLGDAEGELPLHISRNSVSSSFLRVSATSTSAEPESASEGACVVPVRTLDNLLPELTCIRADSRIMLKLDTQGFEARILAGAAKSLDRFTLIQMEMSLVPLYEGESLFFDLCERMRRAGFELIDLDPFFHDPATGRLLQMDGLFARIDLSRPTGAAT